jgi:ADP-heptose:LPS heptosyltransferase
VIANLDAVVTVDTAVAHLAGAMGKPVRLLLWRNADWRWGVGKSHTPWYSNIQMFRQGEPGAWRAPIEAMLMSLR